MFMNKKGAALMQVLLVTIILAGIATMLLRAILSRTTTAFQTRKVVSGQILVESCMAEVNTLWSKKTPEAYLTDFNNGIMYRDTAGAAKTSYTCRIPIPDTDPVEYHEVEARFDTANNLKFDGNSKRQIVYELKDVNKL